MSKKDLHIKRKVIKLVAPTFVSVVIKILHKTIKWKIVGKENLNDVISPVIFSFFHGRMVMLSLLYNIIRKNDRKIKMILSPHFDGILGAKIAEKFGIGSLKGSSSKNSYKLLKSIHNIKDFDIGITPDGPRGPFQKVKSGVVYISKATGFPIVPISYSVSKYKMLKSWDKFIIPLPFSKGVYVIGKPIYIPSTITKEEIPNYQRVVEEEMIRITELSDSLAREA